MRAAPETAGDFAIRPDAIEWARRRDSASRSSLSPAIVRMYSVRRLRGAAVSLANRLEGGRFFSQTLRDIFRLHHGVTIGSYSYGGCFRPGALPRGTTIGNYASVSSHMRVFRRNHPYDRVSQHPFFYNREVGLLERDAINTNEENPLRIGHDTWTGHEVVILPGCAEIGDGAIVGAGSVVTRDVEPFTIVAGNPAKVIRRRFPPEVEDAVRESRWWDRTLTDLLGDPDLFARTLGSEHIGRLLRLAGTEDAS